jgi:hypothetical protein
MAHFAEIDENGTVLQVITVADEDCLSNGTESEQVGASFCSSLLGGTWVQTSYNANIRKNYAGVGFAYDFERDAFIPPQDFPSWTLNESTCKWEPPQPRPTEGIWFWNEQTQQWETPEEQ